MKCISIFKCNPQIEVIDKSHCSLEDVPNFQNYSRSLEELFLDANKLTILNENVFKLTKLRRFSFSDNAIQDIPPDIAKLVNLIELDCSRNKIQVIPEQIKFLRGLQICDFSANNIEYLPTGLVQLKNLTCLTLNYCPIKNLPEDFGLLKNLESLELRENELESLPASITGLESLKKLDLGRNMITKLPEDIGRLTNLEYLLVDGNRLETIPTKIGRLHNLQCLDLSQQEYGIQYLPEEISGLVSLTDLHLSENHLRSLPDGIRNLKNLTIFKADVNLLTELNSNIGGCVSLQELVLTSNRIAKLPSSIGSLTDLRSLNVDSNTLDELTPQIGHLRQLGILSLRDNWLKHIPNEIGQLEMLRVMDVSGNRLEYLPISMTSLGLKALWLSKNQAQPLPKLQIDELPNSGTRVLTCYLLPQQGDLQGDEDLEQKAKLAAAFNFEENYENNRQAAVSFDTAAVDDAELSSDAQFVRHDTPHPRELKARHQKLFTNTEKGAELKGHDNASFSMADNHPQHPQTYDRDPYDHHHQQQQQEPHLAQQQAYQHMEYGSNGLPEIPAQPPQLNSIVRPIQSNKVTSIIRETYQQQQQQQPEHEHYNHAQYDNNNLDNYGQENRYYENGLGDNSARARMQLKERTMQRYKSVDEDDVDDDDVDDNHHHRRHNIDQSSPTSKCYILDIVLRRSKNHGLGLSIAGGKDTPPFKDNDEGMFVSKVTEGGPSELAGLKVGDKILAVNDVIFYDGITHQQAVGVFKKVKPDCSEFTMRILRDPDFVAQDKLDDDNSITQADSLVTSSSKLIEKTSNISSTFTRTHTIPVTSAKTNGTQQDGKMNNLRSFLMKEPEKVHNNQKSNASTLPPGMSLLDNSLNKNIIYTTLVKDYEHDLGLVLENKTDEVMESSRSNWSNIIISEIEPNSIASRDGKLQVNDRLLSINGADVTGVDMERIMLMLDGMSKYIRIVVSRGESDDPIGAALRNMPVRPSLGSWFSSTSNMSHRPSLIDSYQRPKFGGSVSSLQKQPQLLGTKPPKPPKPTHLVPKDSEVSTTDGSLPYEENPIARPRGFRSTLAAAQAAQPVGGGQSTQVIDVERRAWRQERLKSIDNDVELAKLLAQVQKNKRDEN